MKKLANCRIVELLNAHSNIRRFDDSTLSPRGFTLIQLLVVMAIMALLGIAASSGYASLQRSMRERAAVAASSGLLRAAKERAAIDRVPTAVFCYNRLVRDTSAARDENAVVIGVMTAIRRSGRISYMRNKILYDEFGDLDLTYETSGSTAVLEKRSGMRLWKFPTGGAMEYSIVSDAVLRDISTTATIFSGGETNLLMGAFYNLEQSNHEPTWKVGDAYGFEIGEVQLPNGFIFGKKIPSDVRSIAQVEVFVFDPEKDRNETVEVWSTKPNASGMPAAFKPAGTATSDERAKM